MDLRLNFENCGNYCNPTIFVGIITIDRRFKKLHYILSIEWNTN
ncbi:hypothetical protein LEP1GSC021_1031 [Leptospira noguchii str. 1993005606]|uniref:Uncharacterized protein n=2 Tax=Leptospira noguchii TaxID=28182 RepID=M6YNP6_9LEPT|nr:hypothetical protein LEP1GSC035_4460 [Leptospira noguchii str. 2007001578]EMO91229.1 hypothetical protein LEP1GSC024_0220 [Leptospira noguchii str. 2001034031]EPE84437.1 hypothetical protein LEP1GSC021_1031 [Leptospira noguchii str. 1993005606]